MVFAASSGGDDPTTSSGCANQIVLKAGNGIYVTDETGPAPCFTSPNRMIYANSGAFLSKAGTWVNASDRNVKENFAPVDGQEMLDKIAELTISEWNYKREDDDIRHIGPVAQDFKALFGVGADDKSISTVDPSGIALAAIKELYRKTQKIEEQQKQIDELRSQLEEFRQTVEQLRSR
jgi:hypothetical protein